MKVQCNRCGSIIEEPKLQIMTTSVDGHEPEALEVKPQLRLVRDVAIALDEEPLE